MLTNLGTNVTGLNNAYARLSGVQATATADGTALVAGAHNPVDATAGNLTVTLADAPTAGLMVSVSKRDSSTNTVTVSAAHLRDGGAGSITLVGQYEALLLTSKADGSWWPIGDHKTKAWIDAEITAVLAASPSVTSAASSAASTAVATELTNAGVLYASGAPTLAQNLAPDPQQKTAGGTASGTNHPITRITTGLPTGFSYGLQTVRAGTLNSVIAQILMGGLNNASALKIAVTPSDVRSFSAKIWTDQSGAKARLDVRWYSSADALLSTTTGSYTNIAASTWETRTLENQTVPASAAYAVVVPLVTTVSGSNTVTGAVTRVTGVMLSAGATVATYRDGSFGSIGWAWNGAAHASTSKQVMVSTGDFETPAGAVTSATALAAAAVAPLGKASNALTIPVTGYALPVNVRRSPFGYTAEIDYEAVHVRGTGSTIYVDPVNGSNSNDGLTWATAKKDPANAVSAGSTYTVAEVIIDGGVYTRAQNPVHGRADLIIRAKAGTRPVFTQCDTSASWTVQSGAAYQVALSGPGTVIDLTAPKTPGALPIPLARVADIATCVSTAHSAYNDGTTQYVHLFDGRAPDTNVLVSRNTYNLNTTTVALGSAHRLLLDGIEFWGGLYARVKAFKTGATFVAKDCAWRFANENGLGIQGFSKVVNIGCEATHNGIDGFNYHDVTADDAVTNLTGQVLEVNCVGRLNGQFPGSSQNGSTSHENYKIVRVGGVYEFNPGPNVADVGNVLSANFGVAAGDALGYSGTPDYDFAGPEGTGTMYLIGCRSRSAQALDTRSKTVYVQNFQRTGTITGTVVAYS